MGTINALDIFDVGETNLSVEWTEFLVNDEVGCAIAVTAAGGYPSLSCNSKRFWNLVFNTTENNSKFSAAEIDGVFQPDGYNLSGNAVLGLSSKQPQDTEFHINDVLTQFGFIVPGSGLVKTIIGAIVDASISLKIDYSETRCAMWITPGQLFRSDVALTFELSSQSDAFLSNLTENLCQELGIDISKLASISSPKILLQRTCWGSDSFADNDVDRTWDIVSSSRLTIRLATGGFLVWVISEPNGTSFSITPDPDAAIQPTLDGFLDKLAPTSTGTNNSALAIPVLSGILSSVEFQNISIGKYYGDSLWWRVTVALKLVSGAQPVEIYLSYDSQSTTFSGGLMLDGYYTTESDKLLPGYEAGKAIDAPVGVTLPLYLDLKRLSTELESLPSSIPTALALASLSFRNSDPRTLWLSAKLIAPPPSSNSYVPAPFVWDELDIQLSKGATFSCDLSTFFTLNPPSGQNYTPADLGVAISYNSGSWVLNAYITNLSFGLLHSFFEDQYSDALVSVLGKLNIAYLNILYTYEKGGAATSFVFTGIITLGDLELRLFYQYASSKAGNNTAAAQALTGDAPKPLIVAPSGNTTTSNWTFECDLGATGTTATIGTIVTSIVDDASGLPPFVSDIPIPAASGRSPISIKVTKTDSSQLLFAFRISIEEFTLTFVQVANKDKTKPTKRLLRFAVDKIPLIKDIPLLSQLPQPFDQMEYLWVNDAGGLLQSEVDALNSSLLTGEDALLFKNVTTTSDPTKVVIAPGHHFIVIQNGEVAIDHIFFASKPEVNQSLQPAGAQTVPTTKDAAVAKEKDLAATPTSPTSPPAKGTIGLTLGPLTISAVSLQYKEQNSGKYLFVTMDATFIMGPISFSLLGFSIGLSLTTVKLNDLSTLLNEVGGIQFALDGLALSFNKPPLLLAGAFEHQIIGSGADRQEIYLGGIGLSFPPYTFVGVGEYAILNDYKSVFIYAKLDGPLIELEFATISGVRLGLGFNSMVRSPSIDQLTQFPFINDAGTSGAGNDPMKLLKSLCQSPSGDPKNDPAWVTPKNDSYWLAAGMTVTAFDVLTVTAVAMFAFRDSGLIISIFADAIAQMPPVVTDKSETIVYVEIGLVAEMNFVDGYFRVEASLAPTSFLLVPQCHVYGGFALIYWFGANPHAGDWVFSVGGYHRSYTPPAWYPVPKRIGISFQVSDCFSVTGEAYFAITPKVAMGGAMIHAALNVGIVSAWLDAAFDALVNFHPLHYIADFKVSVGVSCDIDVWFIHIHISVQVGAMLHIEGPEFGGNAYVDFYLFGFTVDFGATNSIPASLTLEEFWEMLHKPGPNESTVEKTDANPVQSFLSFDQLNSGKPVPSTESGAALKFILENGNFPQPQKGDASSTADPTSTGAGVKWFVKGGTFQFRIATDFALSHADVEAPPKGDYPPISLNAATTSPAIYSRPMHVSSPITSTLSVTIKEKATGTVIAGWQNAAFAFKAVPTAVWSAYDTSLDPIYTSNPSKLLSGDNPNVPLAMGIILASPPPVLAASFIPAFNATAAANFGILDFRNVPDGQPGRNWTLAATEPTQTEYLPAVLTDAQAKETSEQRWEETQSLWTKLEANESLLSDPKEGILALASTIFGWENRPQTEVVSAGSSPWKLVGALPSKLISNIDSLYLALPRIAVVSA